MFDHHHFGFLELEDFLVGTWTQISGNQLKDGKDGAATEKLHGCSNMQKDRMRCRQILQCGGT